MPNVYFFTYQPEFLLFIQSSLSRAANRELSLFFIFGQNLKKTKCVPYFLPAVYYEPSGWKKGYETSSEKAAVF